MSELAAFLLARIAEDEETARYEHGSIDDQPETHSDLSGDGGETCDDVRRGGPCNCGLERRQRAILAPLASVYADDPDWREEWAV